MAYRLEDGRNTLRSAWGDFLGERLPGQEVFAVTLNFNPCTPGWSGPVFRVNADGRRAAIHPGRGAASQTPISLKAYRTIPTAVVHQRVYELWGLVDRKLFGPRFHKSPSRTSYRGFIEHPDSNVHVHATWNVPTEKCADFPTLVQEQWGRIVAGGEAEVVPITSASSWGAYCAKAQPLRIADAKGEMFVEGHRGL